MNKKEFVHEIMDSYSIVKSDAYKITEIVFTEMRRQLIKGNEVRIDGVGRFSFKFRPAGTVNNNLIGGRHKVAPRVKLKFIPFPVMARALNAHLAKELSDG